MAATALVAALITGASGSFSAARAQASGTLQASVTVLDDLVSRSVRSELEATIGELNGGGLQRPLALPIAREVGVRASVVELEPLGPVRRLRVEIAYLD